MADIPQVLAAYDALVGVALGAGLTYGFGALSRRHQEKREDATRWYEARLRTYAEFSANAIEAAVMLPKELDGDARDSLRQRLTHAYTALQLIASDPVCDAANRVSAEGVIVFGDRGRKFDEDRFTAALDEFNDTARKDLAT